MSDSGLVLYEAYKKQLKITPIDTSKIDAPITIGRGHDCDICIGKLASDIPTTMADGAVTTVDRLLSRHHATIFRDKKGDVRIRDGNGKPSATGIRWGADARPVDRDLLLSEGAYIQVGLQKEGWRCWLEWPAPAKPEGDVPTLQSTQWENANLLEQINDFRGRISSLESSDQKQARTIKQVQEINAAQDQKIRRHNKRLLKIRISLALLAFIIAAVVVFRFDMAEYLKQWAEVIGLFVTLTTLVLTRPEK